MQRRHSEEVWDSGTFYKVLKGPLLSFGWRNTEKGEGGYYSLRTTGLTQEVGENISRFIFGFCLVPVHAHWLIWFYLT